jgi:hypothetical protein
MPQQLVLIEPESETPRGPVGEGGMAGDDWHLDSQTREVGLRGIAEARRILVEASRRAAERSAA